MYPLTIRQKSLTVVTYIQPRLILGRVVVLRFMRKSLHTSFAAERFTLSMTKSTSTNGKAARQGCHPSEHEEYRVFGTENVLTYSNPWPHYMERLSSAATGNVGCGCRVTNLSPNVSVPPPGAAILRGLDVCASLQKRGTDTSREKVCSGRGCSTECVHSNRGVCAEP
jgi:hypothetical protein